MRLLKTETFFEGCMYDRLFIIEDHALVPVDRLFDYFTITYDLKRKMKPVEDLPHELAIKIVLKTIISLLKDFHFSDAMELISINKYMIHHFYFAIFGSSNASMLVKHRRLSRIMNLIANMYDSYFTSYCCFNSPTVLLEYESEFMVSQRSTFYPWNFEPQVSVIQVDHVEENAGLSFQLGESYGDRALLIGAYEKKGILYGEKLAFPFVHFILMDAFQFLNVFENKETRYHFERFSMLIKAIFGKHCKTFYFSEKIPYSEVENEEEYAYIFENRYLFKELSYCVRK
jgi:hypothetical protein